MPSILADRYWVRTSFLTTGNRLSDINKKAQYFSNVTHKFTETSPGGSLCINPAPQYTRYADVRPVINKAGMRGRVQGGRGLGRYYSEAIDDHQQIIHMRFGVPQFNSLSRFFTTFYSGSAGRLARTGRSDGLFYSLGKIGGYVLQLRFWPLLGLSVIANTYNGLQGKQNSRFYYLKPTMPSYWAAVQTMLNQLAANDSITPRIGGDLNAKLAGDNIQFNKDQLLAFKRMYPDIFAKNLIDEYGGTETTGLGTISAYAIATRAQRLAYKQEMTFIKAVESDAVKNMQDVIAVTNRIGNSPMQPNSSFTGPVRPFKTYMDDWMQTAMGKVDSVSDQIIQDLSMSEPVAPNAGDPNIPAAPDAIKSATAVTGFSETVFETEDSAKAMANWFKAEMNDGSGFVGFRVDATGTLSDSFSNTTGESEIQSNINQKAAAGRSTAFNFAGGNLIGGPIGELLGGVAGAVKNMVAGALDSMEMTGLAVLGGAAYVDIPQQWQSAEAQLGKSTYSMTLAAPFNNPMSRLFNIYLPLSCILAGVLPLSTGRQSYSSPFLCELFDQGRAQTRLGVIDSVTVERGVGNTGWSKDHRALQIKVTFTVKDLSTVLHMPITAGQTMGAAAAGAVAKVGGGLISAVSDSSNAGPSGSVLGDVLSVGVGALAGSFDDDTMYTDYLAVLSSMSLADQFYTLRKMKIKMTAQAANFDTWFSKPHFIMQGADTSIGRFLSAFHPGTVR